MFQQDNLISCMQADKQTMMQQQLLLDLLGFGKVDLIYW